MGITAIDLAALPPPQAIDELEFEMLLDAATQEFTRRWEELRLAKPELPSVNTVLLESEPVTIALQTGAYRELLVRQRINEAVRASLLAFAKGSDLDHLAAFYDVVRLPGELDDRLRLRVILAIQGRSTGGTAPRYRGVALAASLRVADARVYRVGRDPTIFVAVYATDNSGVADAALLAQVSAALNDDEVRLINDTIVVRSAIFNVVDIVADVWLLPDTPDTVLGTLSASLREAWMTETGLGFDLTLAWATARLMRTGVYKVQLLQPGADVRAEPHEALAIGQIQLNNRGRDY
ncbi:phage-related baseplate assembly protein [Chelatococcus caeni]|uniref:Phage-related baseplate assembly protein n=1 Tax=Chelatococcus caeni TaxID=1348468 RepID=A0A840C2R7_9HYPH|nr:baseplate J/gp47 family protein [Chelatococcus caeni]MBB4016737.1 phage-related baseplate assembly protein [Chelatococcus caeni]